MCVICICIVRHCKAKPHSTWSCSSWGFVPLSPPVLVVWCSLASPRLPPVVVGVWPLLGVVVPARVRLFLTWEFK